MTLRQVLQSLLALSLSSGCACGPRVLFKHLADNELVAQSPIIVVGRVESQEIFWNERRRQGSVNELPLFWYHVDVRVAVENVLRGDLIESPVAYTYWLPATAKTGEWNSLLQGARYVHFLRRDGSGLRAVVDFYRSTIRVTTGPTARWLKPER